MMRMQVFRRRLMLATSLFLVLLVFPVFVNPASVIGDGVAPDCGRKSGIYIKSNEDFNNEYEFEGEGTEDSPFIIEGLQVRIRGYGIRIRGTDAHFIIRDCEFEGRSRGWGGTAIYISKAENGVIENSNFYNMYRGIALHKSKNIVIQNNVIDSARIGIRTKHSTTIQISNNEITDTKWSALYFAYSSDCTVTDNTIYDNKGLGIFLYDSGSFNIFGNYLGANEWGNAKDIAGECTSLDTNLWDDDVSLGNEWDDYEGTGVYPIPGNRDSVDRYPIGSTPPDTTAPEWNHAPEDQTIECGDPFEMSVEATDASGISYYWISDTNNFIVDNVDFPGTITWSEPLAIGEYPLEVRAYDQFDNFCSATITVTVQDTVCPEIVGPVDVTYKEGETGKTLAWSVYDINPSEYAIYRNDTPIEGGLWVEASSSIAISIDGLDPATYFYRLEVYDLGHNSASDEVRVDVEPEKLPIPTTTTTIIPKPKTNTDLDAPSDDSMGAPVVEPVVVATGIIAPTILGITILFVLGRKREVA